MRPATIILLILVATVPCHAQSAPTIKGHSLGETLEQFIAESNQPTREQMQRCIASGGKDQYGNPQSECEDFLKASRTDPTSGKSGNGSFACQDPIYNLGVCRDFRGKVPVRVSRHAFSRTSSAAGMGNSLSSASFTLNR